MTTSCTPTLLESLQEEIERRRARNSLLDFCCYTKQDYQAAPHLERLAAVLERVERGECKRLIVTMPPRHGKSELISIRFPCWYLGRHPTCRVVQAGYAESISLVHSRQARDIFVYSPFQVLFPEVRHRPERAGQEAVAIPRQAAHEWGANQGGSYYAVGIGGSLTGRGFDLGIIDDPIKDAEEAESETIREKVWEWYRTVFRTRAQPGAAIILVMTRWHQDDLVGKLLKLEGTGPEADKWEILHLLAINEAGEALWPERYPLEELQEIRASIGSKAFAALYQGNPEQAGGNIFRRDWWQTYRDLPAFELILQSWDTAFKEKEQNDFSVCTTWGVAQKGYYLIDVWRQRAAFPALLSACKALADKHKPHRILIEDKASGQSLLQTLRQETKLPILPFKPDSDKVVRANAVTGVIEAGRVFLPEHASWLHDFVEELSAFPNGAFDDQVDSLTQVLNYLRQRQAADRKIGAKVV